MALVTVTIDGQTVQVPEGTSVLDAARSIGINIPALCHDPDLTPVGACRLCVVEVERMRNLPASCVTICTEGMVIRTNTPQIREARKTILELLVANHPLDCLTCEKSGDCLLQEYCYDWVKFRKNRARSTIQVVSSITTKPPEPIMAPAWINDS